VELPNDGAFALVIAQQPAEGVFGGLGNTRSADRAATLRASDSGADHAATMPTSRRVTARSSAFMAGRRSRARLPLTP
jgi:hypothetical protein